MLRARMTLPHFSVSSTMSFPNAADVIDIGSTPKPASRAFMRGSAATALISLLSFSITSAGVSFGADPIPLGRLVARDEFGQGRNIRQHTRTGLRCNRQRARHVPPPLLEGQGYG